MKKVAGSVLGAAGLIAVLTLVSRIMGLVRKLAQSWAVSDGPVATAYDTANTVPNVLFEVAAGGALAGAVIPLISRFLARKMHREASQTASALISWILLIGLPLAGIVILFANPIVGLLFGPEADPGVVSLSATLLRMFALQVPLYGLSVVFTGVLQAHKRFVLPALAPLLSSIVVIGVFSLYALNIGPDVSPQELSKSGIYWLGWGTTAGVIAFSLPQAIPVLRLLIIRPTLTFPAGVARHTLRLAGAGLAALLAQQIAIVTIMFTANNLGDVGTYAAFNYAYSIYMVPYAVLAVPIATAVFPRISEAVELEDRENLSVLVSRSTRLVLALGLVAVALLVVLARPAQIVIEVGNPITALDTAMRAMAPSLVGFSMLYHGARVLYAMDAGKRVIQVNSLAWGVVVLTLVAANLAGVSGREPTLIAIGVAMSVGLTVGAIASVFAIRAEIGPEAVRGYVRTVLVLIFSLLLAGGATWFAVHGILEAMGSSMLGAFVSAAAGAIVILGAAGGTLWLTDRRALTSITR